LRDTIKRQIFVEKPTKDRGDKLIHTDLGLKDFAAASDSQVIGPGRRYRKFETRAAAAQRARKQAGVCAVHAKTKNSREGISNKLSAALIGVRWAIFIGDMNPWIFMKTRMVGFLLDSAGACS
jgi:hypothetical protein